MDDQSAGKALLSATLIVKNEEHNVHSLLRSLDGLIDELVVVDTGSTDGTIRTIEQEASTVHFPVRLERFAPTPFHFGKAKNHAINRAIGRYVLVIDADERPSRTMSSSLRPYLEENDPIVMSVPRIDELLPHYLDTQVRIFKNGIGIRYGEDAASSVHEALVIDVKPSFLDAPILHLQGRNHWLRRPWRVRQQLMLEIARANRERSRTSELLHAPIGFFYKFRSVYFRRYAWKDSIAGFVYAFLKGLYVFAFHVGVALKPRSL